MSTPSDLPSAPSGRPPIPGVRYRTEQRERLVPETINGTTRMVPETYDIRVPVSPHDWDRTILRTVTGAAVVVTALSVAWTTAGIGALLAPVVPDPIAYGAAAIFDTGWLACQALEWLERYEPNRAQAARNAGWTALAIAVTAVVAHGVDSGEAIAGSVGAAVSLIAKGLWVIVLRHYAVPLGERVGGWLLLRRREVAAQRALSGELRRLAADEAYSQALFRGLTISAEHATADTNRAPADAGQTIEPVPTPEPAAPPAVPAPNRPPTTPGNVPQPGRSSDEEASNNVVRPIRAGSPFIADTVRACLREGVVSDAQIIARVREVHGDRRHLEDTVARTRRRVEPRNASWPSSS